MDQIRNDGVNAVARQEQLKSEMGATQQSGLRIFNAVKERSETRIGRGSRLSCPFVDLARIPAEDISRLKPSGKLNLEQLRNEAIRGAAGIAIEAAAQIVDARPISQGVVEDRESLTKLRQFVVKDGAKLIADFLGKNDPITTRLVIDAARSAMIRHNSDPDQHKNVTQMPEEKVEQWVLQQFRMADGRLSKMLDIIRQYHY